MPGNNRRPNIPVLMSGDKEAVSNREKADLLVETFQGVHSSSNVSNEGLLRRAKNIKNEGHKLEMNLDNSDGVNVFFYYAGTKAGNKTRA